MLHCVLVGHAPERTRDLGTRVGVGAIAELSKIYRFGNVETGFLRMTSLPAWRCLGSITRRWTGMRFGLRTRSEARGWLFAESKLLGRTSD